VANADRMNREQFAAATAGLGEAELRKALWTVYWRGTAAVRERIEEIIAPEKTTRRAAPPVPDPDDVLAAVRDFTALVRSGAYIAGSRAVRPKERSQWRFTFRRLLAESRAALATEDPAGAEAALTEMIDLACRFRDYDYVRSDDPIEAAAVVVSDEIAVLWHHLLDHHGFAGFAAEAAGQFLRWESRYGWTRSGWGKISERESRLSDVLAGLLTVPDTWVTFTQHYLHVMDGLAQHAPRDPARQAAARRAETMIDWHLLLMDRFIGSDEEPLLDRIAQHPALGGPEQAHLQARLAQARGDLPTARQLIFEALERLPGHHEFLELARQIDAPLPPNARRVAASRRPSEPW